MLKMHSCIVVCVCVCPFWLLWYEVNRCFQRYWLNRYKPFVKYPQIYFSATQILFFLACMGIFNLVTYTCKCSFWTHQMQPQWKQKKKEKRKKHWRKSVKRLFHISLVAGHECNIQIGKHSLICLVRDATDAKAYSSLHNIEFHITEDCVVWGPHYGGVVCSSFFFRLRHRRHIFTTYAELAGFTLNVTQFATMLYVISFCSLSLALFFFH